MTVPLTEGLRPENMHSPFIASDAGSRFGKRFSFSLRKTFMLLQTYNSTVNSETAYYVPFYNSCVFNSCFDGVLKMQYEICFGLSVI